MKEEIKTIVNQLKIDEATKQSLLSRIDTSEITVPFLTEIKQLIIGEIDKKVIQLEELVNQAKVAHDNFTHTLDLAEIELDKHQQGTASSQEEKESAEEELRKLKEIRDYLSQIK